MSSSFDPDMNGNKNKFFFNTPAFQHSNTPLVKYYGMAICLGPCPEEKVFYARINRECI